VITLFAKHLSEGNLDKVMALYEPEATHISASGEPLRASRSGRLQDLAHIEQGVKTSTPAIRGAAVE
jgi:hypothetical protein